MAKKAIPALAMVVHAPTLPGNEGDEEHEDEGEDAEKESAKKDAMSAFIDALSEKDVDAALKAYSTLTDLHQDEGEEAPEAEEDTAA